MEDLVEETADQGRSDVKLGEEQRQAGVTCLPQPQTLLILLIDAVAAQHALSQLGRGKERIKDKFLFDILFTPFLLYFKRLTAL